MAPGARRPIVALAALALVAALAAGCGGDDQRSAPVGGTGSASTPARTGETPQGEAPRTATGEQRGASEEPQSPEEEVPGGPGDEIAASGPADFTGRGGRVMPRVVRVPPFLGISVTLRSADGGHYGLRVAGKTLRVGSSKRTAAVRLEGLRPGRSHRGTVLGAGGAVRIVASAEPGP